MKNLRFFACSVIVVGALPGAVASNGLQLIGFSLKQLAVAGAVTANPQSPVTALTNPAGLEYVQPQTEATLAFALPDLHTRFNAAPGSDAKSSKEFQLLPSIGVVAPVKNDRIKFGFAMGLVAGSGTDYSWPTLNRAVSSDLQVIRIAPAVSYRSTDRLTLGAALNLNVGRVSLYNPGFGPATLPSAFSHGSELVGIGGTLGVMYDAAPSKVRVGAAYTTRANFPKAKFGSQQGEYRGKFDLPQTVAVGVHVNPDSAFSVSADVKWLNYKDTLRDLFIYAPGSSTGINLNTKWNDQYVFAIAAQYKTKNGLTYSAGWNHCNKPFDAVDTSHNLMLPAISQNHFTFGVNYEAGSRWSVGAVLVTTPKESITDGVSTISNQITTLGVNATVKF